MRKLRGWMAAAAALVLLPLAGTAGAAPTESEQRQVWDDVGRAALKGPVDVPLLDEAVLHVPAGEVFVPQPQADALLNLFGNPGRNPDMPGLLLPRDPKASWYMPVRFHNTGYIRDDDVSTWNADEMLRFYRDGTEEQNKERARQGLPGLAVEGWSEPPRYDAARQRLVWAMTSREIGARPDAQRLVNYNAFALGRDGYVSMNLVAKVDDLPALRPLAEQQLAALEYNPGKRYADFNASTDRIAGFGVGALVVDVAAQKVGFAARALGYLAHSGRLLMIGGVALVVLLAAIAVARVSRRRRPAANAPVFANTVAEPPSVDAGTRH